MGYIIGVDIGGTFTDCIVIQTAAAGSSDAIEVRIGKAPSTPPDFQTGFVNALRAAADQLGVPLRELLDNAKGIYHGCTVGTNALVEGRTARVGLLTSRGHRDSVFIMQAGGRLKWMPAEYIAHVAAQTKPAPLVPKSLCEEIDERVAFDGEVIVEMNEEAARASIQRLLDEGVEAFSVSLLWSTVNDSHERRLKAIIQEMAPDAFVSISSEVIARNGEYERTIATIVNSLIGPPMDAYLRQLEVDLKEIGYQGSVQIMSCSGGLIDSAHARQLPVLTIGSGPVAGLIGAANLVNNPSNTTGRNIITADMGGTTLDVGLIFDGKPAGRPTASYGQFEYFVPTLDVRSVGSGGGSIINADEMSLRVGPESAGARPGPACFMKGGTRATVADANVVLGYLNPDYFLGGRMKLSREAALAALAEAGAPLGFNAAQTAAAAGRIVDNQMADAIRLTTIQQGYDVRDFIMYAYGGAGPVHATAIAQEIGIQQVMVPLSNFAAGWSAFGVAASEALVVEEAAVSMSHPFDPQVFNRHWAELEEVAIRRLRNQGVAPEVIRVARYVDMRYAVQVNQIEISAPDNERYDEQTVHCLMQTFESEYERLFGQGSGYADAGYALTALRVRVSAPLSDLAFDTVNTGGAKQPLVAKAEREVIWYERGTEPEMTPIYDGTLLSVGQEVAGPAILEYPDTTVVLRYGNVAQLNSAGCIVIDINAADGRSQ